MFRLRSCVIFAVLVVLLVGPAACHDGAPPSPASATTGVASPPSNDAAPSDTTDSDAAPLIGADDAAPPGSDAAGAMANGAASGAPLGAMPSDGGVARVVVHTDDDGKTFDLAVGSHLVFALANHSGTGFIWTPTHVDASILAPDGMRRSEVESDVPGAPKRDVVRYLAKKPGTTVVEMTLKRPFGNAPPGPALHVTVRVH